MRKSLKFQPWLDRHTGALLRFRGWGALVFGKQKAQRSWQANGIASVLPLVATGALPGFLTAALAPRIRRDFPFEASSLGIAAAIYYLVSFVLSSPMGHWVERVGAVGL